MNKQKRITILGAGSFGTAMAYLWQAAHHHVVLWGRNPNVVSEINQEKTNKQYLPNQKLNGFVATTDLSLAMNDCDYLVLAVDCQNLRAVLTVLKEVLSKGATQKLLVINLSKGLEQKTFFWPHQIILDVLGENYDSQIFTLSGPTFAAELLQKTPSAAVLAGKNAARLKIAQNDLSLPWFRLYSSEDILGVAIGGATKNVFAIGTGVLEGLQFGANAKASFITRCLNEMSVFGTALGATAATFTGLSGLGDLILTATGGLSRNRQVGIRLGQGESLKAILDSMKTVAEGVATAQSLNEWILQNEALKSLDLPNFRHIHQMLFEGLLPLKALNQLLSRPLRAESSPNL